MTLGPDELKLLKTIIDTVSDIQVLLKHNHGGTQTLVDKRLESIDKRLTQSKELLQTLQSGWDRGQRAFEERVMGRSNFEGAPLKMWNIVYDEKFDRRYEFSVIRLLEQFADAYQTGLLPIKLHIYAKYLHNFFNQEGQSLIKGGPDNPYIEISGHKIAIVLHPENFKENNFKGASFTCVNHKKVKNNDR